MGKTNLNSPPLVDWESSDSRLLLNPRLPLEQKAYLENLWASAPVLAGHLWLSSSGSETAPRLFALSKLAFLRAAQSVNAYLQASTQDVWLCPLPTFHVGGLSIFARAFLTGSRVELLPEWEPHAFLERCRAGGVTLTSLVPAQVYDLVEKNLPAPPEFRALLVGGDALRPELYRAIADLGWAPRLCYGMTETCAFFAATPTPLPDWTCGDPAWLEVLPHAQVRLSEDGEVEIQSTATYTLQVNAEGGVVHATDFILTRDRAELHREQAQTYLKLLGRSVDFVKVGAEWVSLAGLRAELAKISAQATLLALADARLGYIVHLAVEKGADALAIFRDFAGRVRPFEKPRSYSEHSDFPRSALGKIRQKDLLELIQRNNKNMPLG